MIQLNQVRCFVAVARELHFGRAAERLHMTQPPLSRQIQQLEHALGVELLERDRRQVRLTPAGRAFLPEAAHLLQVAEAASINARRAAIGEIGAVSLGFVPGASCTLLPPLIAGVVRDFPGITIDLHELSTNEQLDALRTDRLDLGLIRVPSDTADFETALLVRETFVAALPAEHPWTRRTATLTLSDFHHASMVMYHPAQGGYFHELLTRLFQAARVAPRHVQYARQAMSLIGLVGAGLGVALVPASNARIALPDVVYRPVDLPAEAVAELHLIWHRPREQDAPAVGVLRRHIVAQRLADGDPA